jgi:fumarate hydratase class II
MIPVMTFNFLQSAMILGNAAGVFADRCIAGTEANREVCLGYAERSPALATALAPTLGYDKAAELAKKALEKNVTVRELVVQEGLMDDKEAAEALDPGKMTNT